ncbi:hypothetical protein FB567DRAFT_545325 [Paraphoma chrysanthemicola]|uniref:Uncharacterized protein n=1 Tax=Paraphoma chrysanthemicola TaxID=798071 RepID=A0A8K0W2L0_9PLEO|nr:hypothetical protein FB567DRAFT_545325 [Paraphoma chrysanthemicola]
MSNSSLQDQVAYHDTPVEALESQNRRIVKMYNDIKYYKDSTVAYQAVVRKMRNTLQEVVDMVPDPNMKDKTVKLLASRRLVLDKLDKLEALHAGQILLLEEFELEFREEWKQKKKQSLEKRIRFLLPKFTELDRFEEVYRREVKPLSKEVVIME